MQLTTIQMFAGYALPVLFAITVHEVAHGWIANKFGDKTALIMGRISLNPMRHIDIIGTILVPALLLFFNSNMLFGWAKPVPVNYANLRHPRRDAALVAFAGPAANLLMALLWALIAKIGIWMLGIGLTWSIAIVFMGQAGIIVNLVLMTLNLIPIPPLDGGKILMCCLPGRLAFFLARIEPLGFLLLLILLTSGKLSYIIGPIVNNFIHFIITTFGIHHIIL